MDATDNILRVDESKGESLVVVATDETDAVQMTKGKAPWCFKVELKPANPENMNIFEVGGH